MDIRVSIFTEKIQEADSRASGVPHHNVVADGACRANWKEIIQFDTGV